MATEPTISTTRSGNRCRRGCSRRAIAVSTSTCAKTRIDHDLFHSVPVDLMFRYNFVPLQAQNGTLDIALADPRNLNLIDELSILLGKKLQGQGRDAVADLGSAEEDRTVPARSRRSHRRLRARRRRRRRELRRNALDRQARGRPTAISRRSSSWSTPRSSTRSNGARSDIHIETRDQEVAIKYRIDGVLHYAMPPIAKDWHSTIISRIKVMSELDIAERRVPQDGRFRVRYKGRLIDFRVSIMPTIHGEDAVLRVLDKESMSEKFSKLTLDVVGFSDDDIAKFRRYIKEPYGMVLVTGPTGSGKTTTLYAALSEIKNDEDKIITIEDPVEYQLKGITQIPVNEKKGLTFARGLRSILRHDPDKIMVGEIRDQETAQIAINAALTGHLVFTTVHANNVLDVLGRFLNMGVEPYNFVSALNCILAQRLVRVICAALQDARFSYPDDVPGRERPRSGRVARLPVLRRHGLLRVRRHRIPRTNCHSRAARSDRAHPRDDSRQTARHPKSSALAREEGMTFLRESAVDKVRLRRDHSAGNQQGDVHRGLMASLFHKLPRIVAGSRSRTTLSK